MRKRHPCVPPAAPAHVRGIAWLIASGTLGPQDTYHSSTVHNGFFGSAQTLASIGVLEKRVREFVGHVVREPAALTFTPRANSNTGLCGNCRAQSCNIVAREFATVNC